jgi:hypothetical protein
VERSTEQDAISHEEPLLGNSTFSNIAGAGPRLLGPSRRSILSRMARPRPTSSPSPLNQEHECLYDISTRFPTLERAVVAEIGA